MAHKNNWNKLPKSVPEVSLSEVTNLLEVPTPNAPVSWQPLTQTGQNPVSLVTVKSMRLTDSETALVRKDEARNRKVYFNALEADAESFVKKYQAAKSINDEVSALHRKFKDVVDEMRPVFERIRLGFAHLRKGETVMGETTGEAWAQKCLGITYNWLCRCLKPPKAGKLLLTDGTKVLDPPAPKQKQSLPKPPTIDTADWTDNQYIQACVRLVANTLKPLESDPQRFVRLAEAIAAEILGDVRDGDKTRHEPDVSQERQTEITPEPPGRNPWWSMTPDEKKQFAVKRLRETLAAKRAEAEQHPVLPSCIEQPAVN